MVVVLPEPFGPRKPCTSPAADGQVEPVERAGPAEGLDQAGHLNGSFHGLEATLVSQTCEDCET